MTSVPNLAVITPDSVNSGIAKEILEKLTQLIGHKPAECFHARIDGETAKALYPHLNEDKINKITELFSIDASIVALWNNGPSASTFKGPSHPALCCAESIRKNFPCDTSVLNLLHCSDDAFESKREFDLIKSSRACNPSFSPACRKKNFDHLAFVNYAKIAETWGFNFDGVTSSTGWTKSEIRNLINKIDEFSISNQAFRDVHSRILRSDEEVVDWLSQHSRIENSVQQLSIKCIPSSIELWRRHHIIDAIKELNRVLGIIGKMQWVICGSTALLMHGLPVAPKDIDIRCNEGSLIKAAEHFGERVIEDDCGTHKSLAFKTKILGWDVEFGGSMECTTGAIIKVTEALLERASEMHVQSAADSIVEFLAMNRKSNKNDLLSAKRLQEIARPPQSLIRQFSEDCGLPESLLENVFERRC